jgi:G patch domain/KOW motif-containing protein
MSGFSMSLGAAKVPKKQAATAAAFVEVKRPGEEDEQAKSAQPEFVSQMVGGHVDGKTETIRIIPAQQNTFTLGGAQHLRAALTSPLDAPVVPESADAGRAEGGSSCQSDGVLAVTENPSTSAEPLSEDARAAQAIMSELRAGGSSIFSDGAAAVQDDTERYRLDVATRVESASAEAYESMPIADFGKAYLRGLGWEEGKPMGNNGNAICEPIEYVPRPQLMGLGAKPKPSDKGGSGGGGSSSASGKKKFIKPGESREPKKDMIYVDEHGRQRHIKRVGAKLVEREAVGFSKGALLAVTHGVHKGLYGRVLSTGGIEQNLKVVLKLTVNGEEVTISAADCQPVIDTQLERAQPGFTHQQHAKGGDDSKVGGNDGRGGGGDGGESGEESSQEEEADEGSGRGEARKRKRKHKKEHREHKERSRDRPSDGERERGRDHKRSKDHHHERERSAPSVLSGGGGDGSRRGWVRESIRVRVVDKRFARGQLYNKKGVVVDVSGVDSFSIKLDDDGKLYEGLRHAEVETALPKRGGTVLVLAGPHRMRRGTLLDRRTDEARADVQLAGDLSVIHCSFDDVAEWVGTLGDQLDEGDL